MLQLTPHMRVLVAIEPADFRCGIDGLARSCKKVLEEDPFSGALFVFRNRRKTAVKVLVYDGQGFWLCYKRLSTGKFKWWPSNGDGGNAVSISAGEVQILLSGGNAKRANLSPEWRPIRPEP